MTMRAPNPLSRLVIKFGPTALRLAVDRLNIISVPGCTRLLRLVLRRWIMVIEPYFDHQHYLSQVNPAGRHAAFQDPPLHYCLVGWIHKLSPNANFDPRAYRTEAGPLHWSVDPFFHFILRQNERSRAISARRQPVDQDRPPVDPATPRRAASGSRTVVYTAVVGGYDVLQRPEVIPPDLDFVVLCDRPLDVPGWTSRRLEYDHPDPWRAARHAKLHPHVYFPDHELSIWIDANLSVRGDVRCFLKRLSDRSPVSTFIHPLRDNIVDEGEECIARQKDDPRVIWRQIRRYHEDGSLDATGLWETNVVARRHHDAACVALMSAWWRELEIGSRRDQLSLPVVARRLNVAITPLDAAGQHGRNHPVLSFSSHPPQRAKGESDLHLPALRRSVDADRVPVTVGICVHNGGQDVRNCLAALPAALTEGMEVLLVDDASDAQTANDLDRFVERYDRTSLIRHDRVLGYSRSANDVLAAARGEWIILLNSDTVTPPASLRRLITAGEQYPRLGIVGPLSNAAGWQTVPRLTGPDGHFLNNALPAGVTAADMARLCEHRLAGTLFLVPLVNGFCMALRRSMLDATGFFDEESFAIGYGEEDDLCLRAADHGFACAIAADSYVFHVKSASFTLTRRDALSAAGQKALVAKHGEERVRAAVRTMRCHPGLAKLRRDIAFSEFRYEETRRSPRPSWRARASQVLRP